jgi:hypothetical protein
MVFLLFSFLCINELKYNSVIIFLLCVLTFVNTDDAVDQDKQGTSTRGLGQFVADNDAI